jgi:hypothetical protein
MLVSEVTLRRNRDRWTLLEMWEQTRLLGQTPDHLKSDLALVLENQRLYNENIWQKNKTESVADTLFKKLNIPIVTRVFNSLLVSELVTVQSFAGPTDILYHLSGDELIEHCGAAKTRLCKTEIPWYSTAKEGRVPFHSGLYIKEEFGRFYSLDQETEVCATVARDFTNEIHDEIIRDLSNNSLTCESNIVNSEIVKRAVDMVKFRKELTPNWIVVSPDVAASLNLKVEESTSNLHHCGEYQGLKAYCYDNFDGTNAKNRALLGFSETPFQSHYVYAPYIMLTQVEKYDGEYGLMMRYGKKIGEKTAYISIKGGA